MEIIGVGFGRTGTLSLKIALEQLGFSPCYHMAEIQQQPLRMRDWLAVLHNGDRDWARIFAGYRATVDWPGTTFWRELVDAYPAAPVILTVRDPDTWYASAEQTIYQQAVRLHATVGRDGPLGTSLMETTLSRAQLAEFYQMIQETVWQRVFDGRFADRGHALDVYHRHIRDVRNHVAAGRLLVYDVRDGWAPLCTFLGVPVPETPFPRSNNRSAFNQGTNSPRSQGASF
jgi:hypothetical protein